MIREIEGAGAALLGHLFILEFNGLKSFQVESFEAPGCSFEVAELDGGGQSVTVKQAGGEKIGEFTTEIIAYEKDDIIVLLEDWRSRVATRDPSKYYADGTATILGPNDEPAVVGDIEDAWPFDVKYSKFDSKNKKDLVKATIKWHCNYFRWRGR